MASKFEPVSLKDLKDSILKVIPGGESVGRQLSALKSDGGDRLKLIGLASLLLFLYERGRNPAIQTIADATLYCSSVLAAGHPPTQPVTTVGKLVGSLLLNLGSQPAASVSDQQVADTLQSILKEFREHPPTPPRELAPVRPLSADV